MNGQKQASGKASAAARLADDTSGAVLVMGVFMAAFLVGAAWYLIGIGDTIIYREQLQDASDAVAYAGAVYHARGMNVIAWLNLVLAALLGVVTIARILAFANTVVNVASCVCAAVPFTSVVCAPICSTTSTLRTPLRTAMRQTKSLYNKAGPAISKMQTGVAYVAPWLAEAKALTHSQTYGDDVRGGGILSLSLVPGKFVSGEDERLALPVAEGSQGDICRKVSMVVTETVLAPIPAWGRRFIEDELQAAVDEFCMTGSSRKVEAREGVGDQKAIEEHLGVYCDWASEISGAIDGGDEAAIRRAIERHRVGEPGEDLEGLGCYRKHKTGLLSKATLNGDLDSQEFRDQVRAAKNKGCDFSKSACLVSAEQPVRDALKTMQRRAVEKDTARGASYQEPEDYTPEDHASLEMKEVTPKVIYGGARHGRRHFQVWSLTLGADERASRAGAGVAVATSDPSSIVAKPHPAGSVAFTQAEFYYDTDGPFPAEEALWNINWRARLRRVHPATLPNFGELLAGELGGELEARLGDLLSVTGGSDAFTQQLTDAVSGELTADVTDAMIDAGRGADEDAEAAARGELNRFGPIH